MADLPFYKVLKDQTRQKILNFIGEKGSVSYTDILTLLDVSTGKLNYHLKILAPFILKENGSYSLNETGESAYMILMKFDKDGTASRSSVYRSLAWLFLPLSVIILLASFPAGGLFGFGRYGFASRLDISVEIIGIALMLVAVFFFYSSGNTRISLPEMISILVMALPIGSFGAFFEAKLYGSPIFHVSAYLFSFLSSIGAIVFFSTFVSWTLYNRRRWLLAIILMAAISMYFIAPIIYYAYTGLQGYSEVDVSLPLPGIFLVMTAISSLVRRINYSTSEGGVEIPK